MSASSVPCGYLKEFNAGRTPPRTYHSEKRSLTWIDCEYGNSLRPGFFFCSRGSCRVPQPATVAFMPDILEGFRRGVGRQMGLTFWLNVRSSASNMTMTSFASVSESKCLCLKPSKEILKLSPQNLHIMIAKSPTFLSVVEGKSH